MYTDATLFAESNTYSYAMLARDHEGKLVEAVSSCKQGNIDPELADAIWIREALSWVKSKAWPRVVVEIDCLVVTKANHCLSTNLSYLGRVIDECKSLLVELVDRKIMLKFVKRSENKVAHFIARHNISIADCIWRRENAYPEFIHVLLDDLKV